MITFSFFGFMDRAGNWDFIPGSIKSRVNYVCIRAKDLKTYPFGMLLQVYKWAGYLGAILSKLFQYIINTRLSSIKSVLGYVSTSQDRVLEYVIEARLDGSPILVEVSGHTGGDAVL